MKFKWELPITVAHLLSLGACICPNINQPLLPSKSQNRTKEKDTFPPGWEAKEVLPGAEVSFGAWIAFKVMRKILIQREICDRESPGDIGVLSRLFSLLTL